MYCYDPWSVSNTTDLDPNLFPASYCYDPIVLDPRDRVDQLNGEDFSKQVRLWDVGVSRIGRRSKYPGFWLTSDGLVILMGTGSALFEISPWATNVVIFLSKTTPNLDFSSVLKLNFDFKLRRKWKYEPLRVYFDAAHWFQIIYGFLSNMIT